MLVLILLIILWMICSKSPKKQVEDEEFAIYADKDEEETTKRKERFDLTIWKKILKIVIRDKKVIVKMIIAVCLLAAIDIGYPLLNKYALETFFTSAPNFSTKWAFLVIYLGVAVAMGLTVWMFIRCAARVEEATTFEIRTQAFDNLQKLSFAYFDTTSSGWVMARMTSDARRLSSIISWGIVDFLWGLVLMIGILVVSFVINWRLALIITALIPIFLGIAIYFRKKILIEYRSVRKINSAITASFNESFMGANTTKTLVLEDSNAQEFENIIQKMKRRSIRAALFSSIFWPSILVIGYFGVAVVAVQGSQFVLSDVAQIVITTGTLYLFIDYAIKFFDPVMNIARILSDFQQAQASAERVISLIETKPDVADTEEVIQKYGDLYHPLPENWEPLEGEISFHHVSFRYKGTDKYVLEDFELDIKQGETVAFVGETGSGKSTIINLICRFYEPTSGTIFIDGKDYKERSIGWLHHNIGYVLQTPHLFSGTIRDNIRYGKLTATDEEIYRASKLVNAHEFIEKLDKGYDTEVGEGGNKLSIGQKQLISFARAIMADPKILVLDEATSSIDTENEKILQAAIATVMQGRTNLMVAHRLSTVVDADKIIVLKYGKIIEMGNHHELLKKKGYYFSLYKNQFLQEREENMVNQL